MTEPSTIMIIARALGYSTVWNTQSENDKIMTDASRVWDALMDEGFVEDRIDIGASGYCEALVLFFRHHA